VQVLVGSIGHNVSIKSGTSAALLKCAPRSPLRRATLTAARAMGGVGLELRAADGTAHKVGYDGEGAPREDDGWLPGAWDPDAGSARGAGQEKEEEERIVEEKAKLKEIKAYAATSACHTTGVSRREPEAAGGLLQRRSGINTPYDYTEKRREQAKTLVLLAASIRCEAGRGAPTSPV